jgi:hypothetical protein
MTTTETLGLAALPYIGADHSFDLCEELALKHIPLKTRLLEPALFESKWYDYRQLHPTQATYLFLHHYSRAYGNYIRSCIDYKKGYTQAIKGSDLFFPKITTGKGKHAVSHIGDPHREHVPFWKLRQRADRMGVRYDFFCRAGMAHFDGEGWANFVPRPHHLDDDVIGLEILDAWEMELRAKIQWAEKEFYRVENWTGHKDQLAYEAFIVKQIKRRSVPAFSLSTALYDTSAVRIETAMANFESDVIERAIALSA